MVHIEINVLRHKNNLFVVSYMTLYTNIIGGISKCLDAFNYVENLIGPKVLFTLAQTVIIVTGKQNTNGYTYSFSD